MSESVIAVDRGEHVLFANASAGRMLGFRPANVEGLTLLEAVRSHELRELVHRSLRTKELANCELTWRTGAPRTFDVLATPLPGDPPPGVVLVLRDVSELKRLERMRQQFVANVSHELKTPLSSIKAYTETLISGARHDPVHCERFLNRIDEQAARLQELIVDMLSLARIESGQAALDLADVSVARVVRRCIADYEPQAVARELVLENLVDDPGVRVHADEEGLRQILSNLIDNAVKYTPAGGQNFRSLPPQRQNGRHRGDRYGHRHRRPSTTRICSNGFTAWTRHDPASSGAPGWGCRSSSTCARPWAAACPCGASPNRGARFRCDCRWRVCQRRSACGKFPQEILPRGDNRRGYCSKLLRRRMTGPHAAIHTVLT